MNTCQPFDVEGQTNIELQTSASLIRLGGWDSQDAPSLLNKNDIVIIDFSYSLLINYLSAVENQFEAVRENQESLGEDRRIL